MHKERRPELNLRVPVFDPADQLGHGPHGAVDAPAPGLEQHHRNEAQDGGGEHYAVKAKGELGYARMEQRPVIGPAPGQLEGPEQSHGLSQLLSSGKDQICNPEHLEEHDEKENQIL